MTTTAKEERIELTTTNNTRYTDRAGWRANVRTTGILNCLDEGARTAGLQKMPAIAAIAACPPGEAFIDRLASIP